MPSEKIKNLLTEEQKASLAPHVHAFRHGNPQKRLEIVRDLAKGFHPATALPAVHAQYRQAVKIWMFNRGKKPEKLKQFRHRGYSAQDVYNTTCRDEITKAAREAMKDIVSEIDDADEPIAQKDDYKPFVGVRQRILSKMFSELPSSERKRYKTIAEEWTASSAPPDVLRARAKRYTASYTKAYATRMHKELGVRVVVFTMQKSGDGEVNVHFHDYNGYLRGAPTFTQQRPSWQKNPILDELDEYADALFPADGDGSDGENTANTAQRPHCALEYESGYPKIPDPDKLAHKEMQAALREIFTFHYHRASGNFRGAVPWGDIIPRIEEFVDPEYLPLGFSFATPDHLRVKPCVELLTHLRKRQDDHGVGAKVFAWKAFCQKQRGGGIEVTPALIAFDQADEAGTALPPRPRPRPRAKGKGKQVVQNPEESVSDSGMDTPAGHSWDAFDAGEAGLDSSNSDSEPNLTRVDRPGPSLQWMQKRTRTTGGIQGSMDECAEEGDSEPEPQMKKPVRKRKKQSIFTDSDSDSPSNVEQEHAGDNNGNRRSQPALSPRVAPILDGTPSGRNTEPQPETRPDDPRSPGRDSPPVEGVRTGDVS
ncbi:hypothetical protein HWV62_4175 [Athelia sp. TMB]|nr:hypothetical protein HWV62_4175 [Athelia sp. TMB]